MNNQLFTIISIAKLFLKSVLVFFQQDLMVVYWLPFDSPTHITSRDHYDSIKTNMIFFITSISIRNSSMVSIIIEGLKMHLFLTCTLYFVWITLTAVTFNTTVSCENQQRQSNKPVCLHYTYSDVTCFEVVNCASHCFK